MAKLYVYYGAVGSSKTANLLITEFNYREKNLNPFVITSHIDNRSGVGVVSSRIEGLETTAFPVKEEDNIYNIVKHKNENLKIDVVLVDEAQFLQKKHIEELTEIVDKLQISVLTYCLRTDFKGEFFEGSKYLFAWADEIHEVKTMCQCDHKANFNARIINGKVIKEGEQIQIGGNESYISLCRSCWKEGRFL